MNATPMTADDGTDLWVVVSSQGEYSDRREAVVCVCPDEATAQAYVEAAEHRAREIEATMKADGIRWWVPVEMEADPRYRSALDPARHAGFIYSEPTTYYASKAPLRLSVPTPTGRAEG
jgi:hypothetical protein